MMVNLKQASGAKFYLLMRYVFTFEVKLCYVIVHMHRETKTEWGIRAKLNSDPVFWTEKSMLKKDNASTPLAILQQKSFSFSFST